MNTLPIELRPLSAHAIAELRAIALAPVVACGVNPGVRDRLSRGGLVEFVELPSPFPTHKGRNTPHLQLTEAGRAVLEGIQ